MEIVNTKGKTKQKWNRTKTQNTHQYLCELYREYSMWRLITHTHAHTCAHKQQHNTKTPLEHVRVLTTCSIHFNRSIF